MQMVNLDTHVLIHALAGDLQPTEERLQTSNEWSVAVIVLWELAKLQQLGRVELDFDEPDVDAALARLHVWPRPSTSPGSTNRPSATWAHWAKRSRYCAALARRLAR